MNKIRTQKGRPCPVCLFLFLEQLKPHRLDKISFFPKNFFFHFALLTFPHFPVGIVEILHL